MVSPYILSGLDYCNAVLHGAPTGSIQKLQRVQNPAARIVLQAPRWTHAQPLLEHLHWLPVQQRVDYKLAVLAYKVRSTGTPSYLSHHIKPRISTRHLRSSSHLLLRKPTTRTHFADRAFRCTAPTVWNSLNSNSVGLLIRFSSHDCSCQLAPRKSFDILALYKSDYYYYYYYNISEIGNKHI